MPHGICSPNSVSAAREKPSERGGEAVICILSALCKPLDLRNRRIPRGALEPEVAASHFLLLLDEWMQSAGTERVKSFPLLAGMSTPSGRPQLTAFMNGLGNNRITDAAKLLLRSNFFFYFFCLLP